MSFMTELEFPSNSKTMSFNGGLCFPLTSEDKSFGDDYEKKLCHLIRTHIALNVDDRVCYVGQEEGKAKLLPSYYISRQAN